MSFLHRRRKVEPTPASEIEEAQQLRREVDAQWPTVNRLASYLGARHKQNGFGDNLQLTWTPKEKHQ